MDSINLVENQLQNIICSSLIGKLPQNLIEKNSCQQKQFPNSQESLHAIDKKLRRKNNLNQEQIQLIAQLYSQHRSKWSLYISKMTNRNQREIKNFFYNSLRKLATRLSNIQKKKRLFQKNDLDTNMLRNLVDISIIVRKTLQKNSNIKYDLLIYKVKQEIFSICFGNLNYEQQQLLRLSKDIRKLKFMFKNLKHIQKSLISESQAKKFAITVLQKELNSNQSCRNKQKENCQQCIEKMNDKVNITQLAQNCMVNRPKLQNYFRIQQFPCQCKKCVEFHNFQQLNYFQAMQQLHQHNFNSYQQNICELSSAFNRKFYSNYFSNFNPYIPKMCKGWNVQ